MVGRRENFLIELKTLLPAPIHEETESGVFVWFCGDPIELVVRINDQEIAVEEFAAKWNGPHTLENCPILVGTVLIADYESVGDCGELKSLIAKAIKCRQDKFRKCEQCGEDCPPEWMFDGSTCHSCAERQFGVVF